MQNKTSVFRYVSSAFISATFTAYRSSAVAQTSNGESRDASAIYLSQKMLRMISPLVHHCHNHAFYAFSFSLYFTTYIYDYTRVRLSALDAKFITECVRMTTLKTILRGILLWWLRKIKLQRFEYISPVCISATFIAHYIFNNNPNIGLYKSSFWHKISEYCCGNIKYKYFYTAQ